MKSVCPSLLLLGMLTVCQLTAPTPAQGKGSPAGLSGTVVDADTHNPLPGATIIVVNSFASTSVGRDGTFVLSGLKPGVYLVQASHVGYQSAQAGNVTVSDSGLTDVTFALKPQPVTLSAVTVTPGSFKVMGTEAPSRQTLTQREIRTMPQLGDDFFRAIARLPGVGGNDFSTRFTVRGGEYEEVLVTLDGLQIYEPFHLKDIDGGAMSIVDVAAVRDIELLTGGYSAEYGDRMSGVMTVKSRDPEPGRKRLSLGLSIVNARALAEGTFDDDRGSWLVSARRGYIDYVLQLAGADEQIKPSYYDVYGKVQHRLGKKHILSAHVLHAGDNMHFRGEDSDAGDTLETSYGNSYVWLNLKSKPSERLTAQSVVSAGRVDHDRKGQSFDEYMQVPEHEAWDIKTFDFIGLKTDWEYELSERLLVKTGAQARRLWCDYDYASRDFYYNYNVVGGVPVAEVNRIDTIGVIFSKSGEHLDGYLAGRVRLADPLIAEIGARYDHSSLADDDDISPRLSLSYDFGPKTTLRGAWGQYYQTQGVDEISVGDGETDFYPAQKAEQRVIGLEHEYDNGIRLRVEGYEKRYSRLRPAFRNSFEDIEAFPEREYDRTIVHRARSTSRGLEVYLKKDTGGKLSWWLSYALAKSEDSVRYIEFPQENVVAYENVNIPTPNDQRHTFYLDVHYRPAAVWQLTMAFQYHTGWPYTDVFVASQATPDGRVYWLQAGEQWGARHKPFHRLDLRVNRYFNLHTGRITAFIEVLNVLNTENVRSYNYGLASDGSTYYRTQEAEHWFGIMPSFGVAYVVEL